MKKYFYLSLLLFAVLFSGGCSDSGKERSKPKLVMATNATFKPYEYVTNGKIDGIDPAIVGTIANRLGYSLEILDMEFNAVIPAVQSGKADIAASGITVTPDRKKQVLFTIPYVTAAQVIIVKKDSPIRSAADLKNRRIGVQTSTTGDDYVAKNIITPERFSKGPDAVAALKADKLDAVVIDSEPAAAAIAQNPEMKILPEPLTSEEYAFAFNLENRELVKKFNAELQKMKDSGELRKIIERYKNQHRDEVSEDASLQSHGIWKKLKYSFDLNFVKENRYQYLVSGFITTLTITVAAVLLGIFIGFAVAIVRSTADQTGHWKIADIICRIYLTIIRGTPVVVQLLIIYFVIFRSVNIDKVLVAIIAFGINSGAYVAEIIRGGIMSIDRGQMEAGRSLGLSYSQTMCHVILPQAFKNVLPALGNEFIVLLKETSIAGYIAIQDLTKGGDIIRGQTYDAFMPLIAVAMVYLVVVMLLTWLLRRLEKRLKKNE